MQYNILTINAFLAVKESQLQGQKVVFTNGCFDILHAGHVDYLTKAKALGDVLVVGINTDESVSTLKGASRPIQNLDSRSKVLASLRAVDYVIPFAEQTPLSLVEKLKPAILVKGGDYQLAEIVGSNEVLANGGEVKIIPFLDGYSSSSIIEKIISQGKK